MIYTYQSLSIMSIPMSMTAPHTSVINNKLSDIKCVLPQSRGKGVLFHCFLKHMLTVSGVH